ncbi:MAG: alpha/beta fold hydrolase, partial [Pseudomonadota bacterium]
AAALAADPAAARRLITGTGSAAEPEALALYRRLFATPAHVDGALRMMAQWDLEPLLRDLPTLACLLILAVGGRDRAVPPAEAAALSRRLPQASLERHPSLGHVMHEEAPALFAERLRALATGDLSTAARPTEAAAASDLAGPGAPTSAEDGGAAA